MKKFLVILAIFIVITLIVLLLYHQNYKVWDATKKYSYQDLDYLPKSPAPQNKSFIFGVALTDIWGEICNRIWCDDPRLTIEPTLQRLKSINDDLVVIPDVALLSQDLKINFITPGKISPQTKDTKTLQEISTSAKNYHLQTMLITNIIDLHRDVRDQINWQEPDWKVIDSLMNDWQRILFEQAQKARDAQIDYFIVNPGDINFSFKNFSDQERINQKYSELIPQIRKLYQGKLCLAQEPNHLQHKNLVESVDCIVASRVVEQIFTKTPPTTEDADSIQKAWERYFNQPELQTFSGKELFIALAMPSYNGAMFGGWVEEGLLDHPKNSDPRDAYQRDWQEQALVYEGFFKAIYENNFAIKGVIASYWYNDRFWPESSKIKELRPDIGSSIRSKDAEHVFYQWSKVLK